MNTFAKFGVEAGVAEDNARLAVRDAYLKISQLNDILKENGSKFSNTFLSMYLRQLGDMEEMLLTGMGEHESYMEDNRVF